MTNDSFHDTEEKEPDYDILDEDNLFPEDDESDDLEPKSKKTTPIPKSSTKKINVSEILRKIILVVAILVFCYSAGMLIKIFLEYKQGVDNYNHIRERVLDTEQTTAFQFADEEIEIPFVYNHQELLSINPEGIGYIYIPSIDIRLPLVQGTDNDYYLEHTFDGTENNSGCLFEDYRITGGLSAGNVIIYGHNLKNNSMFAPLLKYQDEAFYFSDNNDTFLIYTEDKLKQYRIFSVYVSDSISDTYSFNFGSQAALQKYANTMKAKSIYDTGVDVDNISQVITLSTCTNDTTRRVIVQGAYVSEAPLNN